MILSHMTTPATIEKYTHKRYGGAWAADYSSAMRELWWNKDHRPNRQAAIDEWRRMTKVRSAQQKAIDRSTSLSLTTDCIEAILDAKDHAMSMRIPICDGPTFLNELPDAILHCYVAAWAAAMAIEFFTDSPCIVMCGSITHAIDPEVALAVGECSQDRNPLTLPIPLRDGFTPIPLSPEHAEILLTECAGRKEFPNGLLTSIAHDIVEKVVSMTGMSPARAHALVVHALDQHGISCCIFNHSFGVQDKSQGDPSFPMPIIVVGNEERGDGYMLDVCGDLTIGSTQPKIYEACGRPVIVSSDLSASSESSTLFALSMTQTPLMLSRLGFDAQWTNLLPLLASFRAPLWVELKEGVSA